MITQPYHLTFITPCFCAGANPSVAEVRAPSIRGKLRWWFRVLGGSSEQEAQVFGSIAGDAGSASALMVRVADVKVQQQWQPVHFTGGSNTGYILYFAQASQNKARWMPGGALPSGASFELQLTWRRPVPEAAREVFELTLEAFLLLGALGLRNSRGLGCFTCAERPFTEDVFHSLLKAIRTKSPGFLAGLGEFCGPEKQLLEALGGQLRGLRKGYSAGPPHRPTQTPLGSSKPRQASAVYLRPVKPEQDKFRIVVFEAPAEKVLGRESRQGAPRLGAGVPPSAQAPQRGGRR